MKAQKKSGVETVLTINRDPVAAQVQRMRNQIEQLLKLIPKWLNSEVGGETEDDERELEHSPLQEKIDMELKEFDKKLEQKERFAGADTSVFHYEKKVQDLEQEMRTLQKENEQLRNNLANISSSSDASTQKLKESLTLYPLESQVAELKKKQDAQAQVLRQILKSDHDAAKRLQDEIQRIETQEVHLQQKIKTDENPVKVSSPAGHDNIEILKTVSSSEENTMKMLSVPCCSCSRNSSCRTLTCECRAARGTCCASCGCRPNRCSNRDNIEILTTKFSSEESTMKMLSVPCCSCSRNSSCRTLKCECRAARDTCFLSCGCHLKRCSDREVGLDTEEGEDLSQSKMAEGAADSSSSEQMETSRILASYGALLLQTALSKKTARDDAGARRKPSSDKPNNQSSSNNNNNTFIPSKLG